jgi:hypothetical protein
MYVSFYSDISEYEWCSVNEALQSVQFMLTGV